jgi:hypothetical protein
LALSALLGVHLLVLPDVAAAGGRRHHVTPGHHARGGLPAARVPVAVASEVRPKSAFGSPGGFPFPDAAARERVARLVPHRNAFASRIPLYSFVPSAAFYSPGIQYDVAEPAPSVVTVSPVIYASPTVYVSQPVVAQPAPVAAPAEPPLARVVEHPTGRYELRGDGTTTPYEWVWIPHPPAAPPETASSPTRPTDRTPAYRWTDEDGTIFLTNRLDRIPAPHRAPTRESQ